MGLIEHADRRAGTYSRGMLQRLTLARALLPDPALLLLDEPLTGLDDTASDVVREMIRERRARDHAVVIAEGPYDLAAFADEEGVRPGGFSTDARTLLETEAWSGDTRELRGRIREALRLCREAPISAEALMLAREEVPSFKEAKRAFETRYVVGLLERCGGNISRAARLARKDRKDFYDVIRRTGVDPQAFRS